MFYEFAMVCALIMVGRDDDQVAKRLADVEMLRIKAALQEQGQLQFQVQGQVELRLVVEELRRTEEQRVQETRRARIAEAKMRLTVETVSGSVIGDSFRSNRRRAFRP
jgi:hypothetical protein